MSRLSPITSLDERAGELGVELIGNLDILSSV